MVRAGLEIRAQASNDRERIEEPVFGVGMCSDEGVDCGARQILRIEIVSGRHQLLAYERLVLVHEIPAAAVDEEIAPDVARARRSVGFKRFVQREANGIALPPIHALELARGGDELIDHPAFLLAQPRVVVRHSHRLELRDALRQIGDGRFQHRLRIDRRQTIPRRTSLQLHAQRHHERKRRCPDGAGFHDSASNSRSTSCMSL